MDLLEENSILKLAQYRKNVKGVDKKRCQCPVPRYP